VYFHDLPGEGEELYAGEAMLALLETYQQLQDARSAERGFGYYDGHYFQRGRVAADAFVFFANWQSQASRLLFDCSQNDALKEQVVGYVYRMHDRIISQSFYEDVVHHPARQVSVEVACALEGLGDAYALARITDPERAERYRQNICAGLTYLLRLQCTEKDTGRERSGIALSLQERAQRIDITGHAASAMLKSVGNGIKCESIS
jgi:hypothetical protein